MTQESSSNNNPPVMFWNPGIPEQLLLPSFSTTGTTTGEASTTIVARGVCCTGVGCNRHELVALDRILEAHQDYYYYNEDDDNEDKNGGGDVAVVRQQQRRTESLKQLSKQYREAIQDCLASWDASLQQQRVARGTSDGGEVDGDNSMEFEEEEFEEDVVNLDLLKLTYHVMHLLDVFLPLLTQPITTTIATWTPYHGNPFEKPGVATADLVRYLRFNHMKAPEESVGPSESVSEMLESVYPEQFGDGTLFWRLVETLVLRGSLEQAWHVLSKHSSYAQAMLQMKEEGEPEDPYLAAALQEIFLEFKVLEDILLRAPLPGGRTEEFDDAISAARMIEDVTYVQDTDFSYAGEDFGVKPSDYQYWEMNVNQLFGGDEPFLESIAFRKHKLWQEHVSEQRHSFSLARRFPQIDSILGILEGDFSKVKFMSWAEQFCAELLYCKPNLAPRSFSAVAQRIIAKYDDESQILKSMLSIMEGDVGTAIYVVWMMGGASGAALPSTITSLLYSLFKEAGILYKESSSEDRLPEFLCNSAASILSSIDPSIGASQAIHLLMPYALQEGTPSIVASIANILEHHLPLTDASARNLISICRPLVDRQSAEVLDGCCSIVLARYRFYVSCEQHGDAVHWLRRGMELEALVLPLEILGSCYRTLIIECLRASRELALLVLGKVEASPTAHVVAESIIDGLQGREPSDVSQIPAVQLLHALFACSQGAHRSSELIVTCLQQTIDETNGTIRRTLAPISFHWYLLLIAEKIIQEDEKSAYDDPTACAFDKAGMALLMERLMQLSTLLRARAGIRYPEDEIDSMRRAFANALARAFVAENAKKKAVLAEPLWRSKEIKKIRTVSLKSRPIKEQEMVVKRMLDY